MNDYYITTLAAERLRKVYDIAPTRVRQYLHAETNHVAQKIRPGNLILDLGCGYGRIFSSLARSAGSVVGIDTSLESILLGQGMFGQIPNCAFAQMNAVRLGFHDKMFDVVICIQNGISAFHVHQRDLIRESFRVAKPGGTILFSSYCEKFWEDRLMWFQLQSDAGLLGEIDREKTHNGTIVCKDGFVATTVSPDQFELLTQGLDADVRVVEVDGSSCFCEIIPR